jgi:hypothetical protein
MRHRPPTGSGLGVRTLRRRSPLWTKWTGLATAHHIGKAAAIATVRLPAIQLLELLAVPARPGQPPPPSGDPGPLPTPEHDHRCQDAQPAQPPPPTSTPGPPATPGHDHHVLPSRLPRATSIARRQKTAYPRLQRCRAGPRPARPAPGVPGGALDRTPSGNGHRTPATFTLAALQGPHYRCGPGRRRRTYELLRDARSEGEGTA